MLPLPHTPSFSQLSLSRPCLFSEVFSKCHLLHEALPGPREARSLSLSPQRQPRPTVYFPTLLKAPPSQLVRAGLRVPAGRTKVSHKGRQQQVSVDPRTQPQEPDLALTLGRLTERPLESVCGTMGAEPTPEQTSLVLLSPRRPNKTTLKNKAQQECLSSGSYRAQA